MYDRLADWFHLLTPPADYAAEAAEILRLLETHVEGPLVTALELGSGGGNVASHLAARLRLTLTDISPQMLALSRSINPGLEHIEGDMRTLRLGRTFDAVIAHDAITYMAGEADLRAALETAYLHLRMGGAAVFMPDWVRDTYQPRTEHGGTDEGSRGLRYLEWDRDLAVRQRCGPDRLHHRHARRGPGRRPPRRPHARHLRPLDLAGTACRRGLRAAPRGRRPGAGHLHRPAPRQLDRPGTRRPPSSARIPDHHSRSMGCWAVPSGSPAQVVLVGSAAWC